MRRKGQSATVPVASSASFRHMHFSRPLRKPLIKPISSVAPASRPSVTRLQWVGCGQIRGGRFFGQAGDAGAAEQGLAHPAEIIINRNHHADDGYQQKGVKFRLERREKQQQFPNKTRERGIPASEPSPMARTAPRNGWRLLRLAKCSSSWDSSSVPAT